MYIKGIKFHKNLIAYKAQHICIVQRYNFVRIVGEKNGIFLND